ncbi:MAG: hypothetical protein O6930_08125 [Gammaproteobacteria bacterium]|nr:hypothetical protein [Gammaproteobacteria bacterium]
MMLYRSPQTASLASLRTLLAVVALGVLSAPVAAMEEVTVDGARAVLAADARDARFRSDMEAFTRSVELEFKASLASDLKQSVTPPLRLAGALVHNRG